MNALEQDRLRALLRRLSRQAGSVRALEEELGVASGRLEAWMASRGRLEAAELATLRSLLVEHLEPLNQSGDPDEAVLTGGLRWSDLLSLADDLVADASSTPHPPGEPSSDRPARDDD